MKKKKTVIPYICKCEQIYTKNPTTIFWIKPLNPKLANILMDRYFKTRDARDDGEQWTKIDIKAFTKVVIKIENFIFSEQFPQYHNKNSSKKLHRIITDKKMIKCVAQDIPADIFDEIMNFSEEKGRNLKGEKK